MKLWIFKNRINVTDATFCIQNSLCEMVQNSFLRKLPAIRHNYVILAEIEAIEAVLTGETQGTIYHHIHLENA